MSAWVIPDEDGGVEALRREARDAGAPGPGQVRVRMRAASLNYRDLSTVETPKGRSPRFPLVPCSDGAGEVVAVGEGVRSVAVGDRVASCFFQDWADGPCTPEAMASALGGARDGVLAEEAVLEEGGVIPVPAHLDFAEAACLPCAGLTAWHMLRAPEPVVAGETVLILGTGGVSVFAQQFCAMMGARTIVTSSSDEKLARMRAMGAWEGVNYRETPEWQEAVLALTGGRGVDRVMEVGGPGTLPRSIAATKVGGRISLGGILTGAAGAVNPTDIMRRSQTLTGIYVGSRAMFGRMNRAIEAQGLRPVIDARFPFDRAPEAFRAMRAAEHFGKIVIEM
ncbi:MAG: NAD(P)-dependent alcohol dehydrogenase [Pseudomonadota bacterium]